MTFTNDNFAPVYFDEQDEFTQQCADLRSGNVGKINAATVQLGALPPQHVQEMLLALWHNEEPERRVRAARGSTLVRVTLWGCLVFLAVVFLAVLLSWRQGITFPLEALLMLLYIGAVLSGVVLRRNGHRVTPVQLGAFDVLRWHRTVALTGPWVDALDFRIGEPCWFWSSTPYRSVIYPVLADLLPQHAGSDATPLDPYQQSLLLREVNRLTRRLRKQTATLDDPETRFVCVVLQYLAAQRQQSATLPLMQQLAQLPPGGGESVNRRFVREVATEFLPTVQVGRQ